MSVGGSLTGVTFGGLTSGIDTEGIISRILQVEGQGIRRLQRQQQELEQRNSVYGNFLSRISTFGQSANSLNQFGAFNPINAGTSNLVTATVTATASAAPGTYNLAVSKLAAAHKVATSAQASTTDPLAQTGKFVVNGKSVTIEASDSLRSIATKINDLQSGVTASIIDGGAGNAFLTLTAANTGQSNKLLLSDISGSVLANLGILTGGTSIRNPITNGANGATFTSSTDTVQSLLGTTGMSSSTIQINGVDVTLDLATDSLQTVANKINTASTGATATVETVSENNSTRFRLKLTGTTTPTFTDSSGTLQALGIVERANGNQLVAAQDAEYSIDGIALTSASNVITSAVPGATITLLKANQTTPETATLTLRKDVTQIKSKVNEFVKNYNDVVSFIRENSAFNTDTFQTGALFGDSTARQFEATLATQLFNDIPGLSGDYRNLASVGFSLNEDGTIAVDDAMFDAAFNRDSDAIRKLFQSTGTSTNSNLVFVSSTTKTTPSTAAGFNVNISQLATKGYFIAGAAQSAASIATETLTFSGTAFGSQSIGLTLDIGSTLSSTVSKINDDPRLREFVAASIDGGRLRLDAKRFGTAGLFDVSSNITGAANNSGVSPGGAGGTKVNGVDVAGTIAGQAATGYGQFLTGASTNTAAQGLQIQYTGSTTGAVGSMVFSKGAGITMSETVSTFNDSTNGLVAQAQESLKGQIESISRDITRINESLTRRAESLRRQFAAMEEAMARAQAQGSRLSQLNVQQQR